MKTIYLDPVTWDLAVDASGNIAVASDPYSIAQDVASACRLFRGELWYDTTQGVPYLGQILGKLPPAGFIQAQLVQAGKTVPEVVGIKAALSGVGRDRRVTGTLSITDNRGQTSTVTMNSGTPWYVNAAATAYQASGAPFILDESLLDGPDLLG